MKTRFAFIALAFATLCGSLPAQEPAADEEAIHQELIALRDQAVAALNKQEIDKLLPLIHPKLVFTAPYPEAGKEVRRGPEGFKDYYDELFTGPNRRAKSMTTEVKVDDYSIIYGGDTAVAWGSSRDTYHMLDGTDSVIPSRWSCTLVREDGRWLIAEFHVSVNMFNNPVTETAVQKTGWMVGGIAGVVGLLVGAIGAMALGRGKAPAGGGRA